MGLMGYLRQHKDSRFHGRAGGRCSKSAPLTVIHITESHINSHEGTILTPVAHQEGQKIIFIGYINELHYVSTMTDRNSQSKNKLKCIKRKLSETNDKKQDRLLKHRDYSKRVRYRNS